MITGHGDMDLAIESIKHQATDFVTKPVNDDVLDIALNRALEKIRMRQQLREYTENLEAWYRRNPPSSFRLSGRWQWGRRWKGFLRR